MWWGPLANEIHFRCVEGAREVCGRCVEGARKVHGRCKGAWEVHGRCTEGAHKEKLRERLWWGPLANEIHFRCAEGAWKVRGRCTKVHGRCAEGAREVHGRYAEGVMPIILLAVVDSLRTLKVHHCLSMVTMVAPSNHNLVGDNREFEV